MLIVTINEVPGKKLEALGVVRGSTLERLYRDSRCGSLMLPWTAELCLDRLGRECLYAGAEGDESIDL